MKKGLTPIIFGIILVFVQLLSIAGNLKDGIGFSLSFDNFSVFLYDFIFLLSYLSVGIIGVFVLFWGLYEYKKMLL